MTTESNSAARFRLLILQGVLPIKGAQIPAEIIAGITLAALAIPEVMGYTKIAGTPVITGLYTMLIPMALFALFGSSRHLVVGADSATATILAAGLVGLASTGSDEYVALAVVLAFMAAGFLIVVRIIGLGFMADFLSRTVLIGFLTGVGMQVALGEVSGMLGLKGGGHGTLEKIWNDLQQIEQINFHALAVALSVLSLVDHTRRGYHPKHVVLVPSKSGVLHAKPVATRAEALPGLLIYRFTHSMYYAKSRKSVTTHCARYSARRPTTTRWRMF